MPLSFLNPSRHYDLARHSVCFWGHNGAFEIAFLVGNEVLQYVGGKPCANEPDALSAFDENVVSVHQAAARAH